MPRPSYKAATPEEVLAYNAEPVLEEMRHSKPFSQREREVDETLRLLSRFRPLSGSSRVLEIGVGMGWFQVLCLRRGIACEGLELTPSFVEAARELGARFGVEPKIQLGNVETADIRQAQYDVIVAESVLEHTPDWQTVIHKVYHALKPGGVFYFCSSNKFCLIAGDYPGVPFYGWFPDRVRYWLRRKLDGPGIMLWAVDSNQFRYPVLRKFLQETGFSEVLDYIDMKEINSLNYESRLRRFVLSVAKRSRLAKWLLLTFWTNTVFLCRK